MDMLLHPQLHLIPSAVRGILRIESKSGINSGVLSSFFLVNTCSPVMPGLGVGCFEPALAIRTGNSDVPKAAASAPRKLLRVSSFFMIRASLSLFPKAGRTCHEG